MSNIASVQPAQPLPAAVEKKDMALTGYALKPTTFKELIELCTILSRSTFIPKAYQGQVGDIVAASQMGARFGWDPLTSLQSIAVVNGTPTVWGDALRALVFSDPNFSGVKEEELKGTKPEEQGYRCTLSHKTRGDLTEVFTMDMAQKAGLTNSMAYKNHPMSMCRRRAFGRCANAWFPEATKGLYTREIVEESQPQPVDVTNSVEDVKKDGVDSVLCQLKENKPHIVDFSTTATTAELLEDDLTSDNLNDSEEKPIMSSTTQTYTQMDLK